MIELQIKTDDLLPLARKLRKSPELLGDVAQDVAVTVRRLVQGRTPVKSGTMKRSWSPVQAETSGFSFSSNVPYASVLEDGLYPSVGPRTVSYEGGVYSKQAPGGMISPVINDDKVMQQVVNGVLKAMAAGIA